MKRHRIYTSITGLLLSLFLFSQNSSSNYIVTKTSLEESGGYCRETIQYFDGLGRPTQLNRKEQAGDNTKDIITLIQYDELGRVYKEWRPTAINNSGNEVTNLNSFKNAADTHPYSLTTYQGGRLGLIAEQYGPGEVWHNGKKSVRTNYRFNSETESLYKCRRFKALVYTLEEDGYYPENTLLVTETLDEENVNYAEYTDDEGKLVLVRQWYGAVRFDTYYIYDDFGNLRYVLPPVLSEQNRITDDLIKKYAYIYYYNDRQLCEEKQLPGGVSVFYVYDKSGRLRMSRDSNQIERAEWTYYKYDQLGRLIIIGLFYDIYSYTVMDQRVNSSSYTMTESYSASGRDRYTNTSYPTDTGKSTSILVNYYDDYDYWSGIPNQLIPNGFVPNVSDPQIASAKGLLTGRKVALLDDTSQYLWASFRYGKQGLPVQTIEMNTQGGVEKEFIYYSVTGKPETRRLEHTSSSVSTIKEIYQYTYDQADRLSSVYYGCYLTGGTPIPRRLSEFTYNDIGLLEQKKVYKQNGSTLKQTINYKYNIRGWLTEISSEDFIQKLYYTTEDGFPNGWYNGNVTAQTVCYPNRSNLVSGYIYDYDGINRLIRADYGEGEKLTSNKTLYDETLTYDRNGNILTHNLHTRHATSNTYVDIQKLKLEYDGNRLIKATDASLYLGYGNEYFADGANRSIEYVYDKNGNITQDYNKGIAMIEYNLLNLPQVVQMTNGHSVRFTYDALGRKHRQEMITLNSVVNVSMGRILTVDASQIKQNKKWHYCGNVIYHDVIKPLIKYVLTEEGYITYEGYHNIFLKDHLGNVRAELDDYEVQGATNYYPFGIRYSNGELRGSFGDFAFGNKEFLGIHGLNIYDFSKRFYDGALGRWMSMDPLCERFYSWSPYSFPTNNPVRYRDPNGMGPEDRIQAAYNMVGTPYKQQNEVKYRTPTTKEALDYMDCSEFVCRILAADGITEGVQNMNTGLLSTFFNDKTQFISSSTPMMGDLLLWEGHVGIVTGVTEDGSNKVKITHASWSGERILETSFTSANTLLGSKTFHGYYRPINETVDGKVSRLKGKRRAPLLDLYDGGEIEGEVVSTADRIPHRLSTTEPISPFNLSQERNGFSDLVINCPFFTKDVAYPQ